MQMDEGGEDVEEEDADRGELALQSAEPLAPRLPLSSRFLLSSSK